MRNYLLIKPESVEKIYKCFSDEEEVFSFVEHLNVLSDELHFLDIAFNRMDPSANAERANVMLRKICAFTLFCRMNMDLIQQVVSAFDFQTLTKEEFDKMKNDG